MQWTQSNGNDANEMSARKGPLVEVVAEGDHLYVACVREPVPHLETPVLAANSQSQQQYESEGFPRRRRRGRRGRTC